MTNLTLFSALIIIIFGIVNCFFGWRLLRLLIAAWGFIVGAGIGLALAVDSGPTVIAISVIAGGIVGIILSYVLYIVGLFTVGAVFGLGLSTLLPAFLARDPQLLVVLVVSLASGALAVILRKPVVMIVTAFSGSAAIVNGILLLIPGALRVYTDSISFSTFSSQFIVNPDLNNSSIAAWFALGLLGVYFQYRTTRSED